MRRLSPLGEGPKSHSGIIRAESDISAPRAGRGGTAEAVSEHPQQIELKLKGNRLGKAMVSIHVAFGAQLGWEGKTDLLCVFKNFSTLLCCSTLATL